jgi:hypothetical protein
VGAYGAFGRAEAAGDLGVGVSGGDGSPHSAERSSR